MFNDLPLTFQAELSLMINKKVLEKVCNKEFIFSSKINPVSAIKIEEKIIYKIFYLLVDILSIP